MSWLSGELRRQATEGIEPPSNEMYEAADALDLAEAILRRPPTADTEMDEWNLRELLDGKKYEKWPAWVAVK